MANQPGNPNQDARNGKGQFERTVETAEQDALAAKLRARGHTFHEIGLELGITRGNARLACQRALADAVREPAEDLLKLELQRLDLQLVRLDQLERDVRKVLDAEHITVSNGKVILDPRTGQPLADDDPLLRAADRLIKIEDARRRNAERRAKLLGLDAEQKVSVSGSVRYEVVGINPEDLT